MRVVATQLRRTIQQDDAHALLLIVVILHTQPMQYPQQPGWNNQPYPPQGTGFPAGAPGSGHPAGGWGAPAPPQYAAGYGGYPGGMYPQAAGMYPQAPGIYAGHAPPGMYPPGAYPPAMYGTVPPQQVCQRECLVVVNSIDCASFT